MGKIIIILYKCNIKLNKFIAKIVTILYVFNRCITILDTFFFSITDIAYIVIM